MCLSTDGQVYTETLDQSFVSTLYIVIIAFDVGYTDLPTMLVVILPGDVYSKITICTCAEVLLCSVLMAADSSFV